jgi:hypothetical protein
VDVAEPLDRWKAELGTVLVRDRHPRGEHLDQRSARKIVYVVWERRRGRTPARRPIVVNRVQSSTTASARFSPDVRLHFPLSINVGLSKRW